MVHNPSPCKDSSMKKQCVAEEKRRKGGNGFHGDDPEIIAIFNAVKRRRKIPKSPQEITCFVEQAMAELEVAVEDDAQLNRMGQPAISKLQKLAFLIEVLSKKSLQQEFLDRGVLTLLKNWLEPLPDGSLPNANIRGTILKILTDFSLDLQWQDRREQLKNSGLGKAIMFLSKSDEETTSNKKLANNLVENWSRIIFNKSTRFEDLGNIEFGGVNLPLIKKPLSRSAITRYVEADLDLNISRKQKQLQSSRPSSSSQRATRPEPAPLDFAVNPQFNGNAEVVKYYPKEQTQGESRYRIMQRLKQMKALKKKPLKAVRPSANAPPLLLKASDN